MRRKQGWYVNKDRTAWGKTRRVKIDMALQKSIPRGRIINILGNKTWVPFTYEKLPWIYFKCGRLLMVTRDVIAKTLSQMKNMAHGCVRNQRGETMRGSMTDMNNR